MSELGWQIMGLALLLGGFALGERILARRATAARRLAAERIIVLTLVGGFLGAPFWWRGDPDAFAWTLPPLAGRMLAAAGWAFAVACLLALRRPAEAQIRLIGVMLALYLGPLTIAILAVHRDRFDPARPVTWGFFSIVILLLAGALWLAKPGNGPTNDTMPPRAMRWVLVAVGGAAGLWGAALFAWPPGPVVAIWLWPTDALTSRLIASMFLTVAGACWAARGSAPLAVTVMAVVLVYGIGVSLAGLANLVADKPLPVAYMVFWSVAATAAAVSLATAPKTRETET